MSGAPVPGVGLADTQQLEILIDREGLREICRSFFELFNLPVRVLSKDGKVLADVHEAREVCRYVNGLEGGATACSAVVLEVKELVPNGPPVVQACFTGAVYRIVPIEYQGQTLGRFVIGPYLPATVTEVPLSLLDCDPDVRPERARQALAEMPRVRDETAHRIAGHLRAVLDVIVFSGHRASLTSEMHVASVRESYRELAEKTSRLQQAYEKLQELDRLKTNFLATVSHELRTPLTSIIGYSEMLAAGMAGDLLPQQREFIATIRSKGDDLLALITNLLEVARLERGQLAKTVALVHADTVLREVMDTVAPLASKRGIRVETHCSADLPVVQGDPVRIRQVLLNLADNAVKFTGHGGLVSLSAKAVDFTDGGGLDGGDSAVGLVLLDAPLRGLQFAVRDTGIGIAVSEHGRIFDPFYQVNSGSTREQGGAGLGLAIVKRLVDAHGGCVRVESDIGMGTTFYVTLPERDAHVSPVV